MFDLTTTNRPRLKTYSDSTFKNMRKEDLIEYIRTLEHNYDVAVQFNEQQAKNCEELLKSAQPVATGKWLEKEVIYTPEDGFALQSCKCSVCERYDTRPYMYYFYEPRFCSWCGALNGEGGEE